MGDQRPRPASMACSRPPGVRHLPVWHECAQRQSSSWSTRVRALTVAQLPWARGSQCQCPPAQGPHQQRGGPDPDPKPHLTAHFPRPLQGTAVPAGVLWEPTPRCSLGYRNTVGLQHWIGWGGGSQLAARQALVRLLYLHLSHWVSGRV